MRQPARYNTPEGFTPTKNCPTPLHCGSTWMNSGYPRTTEGLQQERRETCHRLDNRQKSNGFTVGDLVEYIGEEPKKSYYLERYPEYDLKPGDVAVLATFGGPQFCCVDRMVDGIVIRCCAEKWQIRKAR